MKLSMSNILIRCLALFLIMVFFGQNVNAVSYRKKASNRVQATRPWSFQIALDETFEDDNDHGFRLSLTRHYSPTSAIRFNLGFVGRNVDHGPTSIYFADGHIFEFENDSDFDLTGANLSLQFLAFPNPKDKVRFYWGAGPRLSINDTEPDQIFFDDHYFLPFDYYDELYYNDFTKVGLGVEGSFGMEMFLARNVSLLAEYGIVLQNEWYLFEYEYYDRFGHYRTEIETFDDGVHFDGSRIKLGLAVYF